MARFLRARRRAALPSQLRCASPASTRDLRRSARCCAQVRVRSTMPRRGSFIIAPSRPSSEPLIRTTKGVSTSGTTCTAKPRMMRLRLFASLPFVRIATPARRDPPNNIDISGNISIIVIKRSFHLSKYFSVLGNTCNKKAKGETITRIVMSA